MAEFVDYDNRVNLLGDLVNGSWTAVTLTPPAGATVAMLRFVSTTVNDTGRSGVCRKIGDDTYDGDDARMPFNMSGTSPKASITHHCAEIVGDQIEVYYSGAVEEVYVIAWFNEFDLTMFEGVDLFDYIDTPVASEWNEVDLTPIAGATGATAALVTMTRTGAGIEPLYFQAVGMPEFKMSCNDTGNSTLPVALVDGKTTVWFSNTEGWRIRVRGLFGSGFVAATSEIGGSYPGPGNQWNDLIPAGVPADVAGVIYASPQSLSRLTRIQAVGQDESSLTKYQVNYYSLLHPVSGNVARSLSDQTNVDWQVAGWFLGSATAPRIGRVNDDNTIANNGPIAIYGTFNEPVTTADIDGYALTISSNDTERTDCASFDIHTTALDYGPHTLTVSTALDESDSVVITTRPPSNSQFVVGDRIDSIYGLAQEGGADGDQWETYDNIAGSNVLLAADTNMIISPATIDGSVREYWRYSGGAWTESWYSVDDGAVEPTPPGGTLVDAKWDALRGQGFTGSISDMTLQWLQANGATSGQISDAWLEMLTDKGAAGSQRSDMWYDLLGQMGYEGALPDREFLFWVDGGLLP